MLDPRAVALQGIGFTPASVAVQGFVEAAVTVARAAGGVSRLRTIADAKCHARGGVSWSRVNPVEARGAGEYVLVVLPADAYAQGSRHRSRAGEASVRASAKLMVAGSRSHSACSVVSASAAASGALSGSAHYSYNHKLDACCSASGAVAGGVAIASANDLVGRGQRRLKPTTLAVIAALVDTP